MILLRRNTLITLAAVVMLSGPVWSAVRAHKFRTPPGETRWGIKTSIPPGALSRAARAVPLEDLVAMKGARGVRTNDPRFQTRRIPGVQKAIGAREGDILSTKGWARVVSWEPDGDFDVVISPERSGGGRCMIVEIPSGKSEYMADPGLSPRFFRARGFCRQHLLGGKNPSRRGTLVRPAVYVSVTGQLFYDNGHLNAPWVRDKRGMRMSTEWELHPVLSISRAP